MKMPRILPSITLSLMLISACLGQVELQTLTTVDVGFLGVFVNKDVPLSDKDILRVQVGLDGTIFGGARYQNKVGFTLVPKMGVELRRYYNLQRRADKGKSLRGNAGNFFSLIADYHPLSTFITTNDRVTPRRQVQIIPSWGLRRPIGKRWSAEAGLGFGYAYNVGGDHGLTADIRLRIGYMLQK